MARHKARIIPQVGAIFHKVFRGSAYTMTVVKRGDGVAYQVGEDVFNTPTAAARSICGTDTNGWRFWGID